MDEFDVRCCNCEWEGYSDALVSKTEDVNDCDFNYCPDCGSEEIEDIDYNDDE